MRITQTNSQDENSGFSFSSNNASLNPWERAEKDPNYWRRVRDNNSSGFTWSYKPKSESPKAQQSNQSTELNTTALNGNKIETKDQAASDKVELKPLSLSPESNTVTNTESNTETTPKQSQKQDSIQSSPTFTTLYPSLDGGTYEGYPELNISGNFYTNGLDHYYKDLDRILPADKDGKLIETWYSPDPYIPKITQLGDNLKAGKQMPRLSAIDLSSATEKEREFHSTLTDYYSANLKAINDDKKSRSLAHKQEEANSAALERVNQKKEQINNPTSLITPSQTDGSSSTEAKALASLRDGLTIQPLSTRTQIPQIQDVTTKDINAPQLSFEINEIINNFGVGGEIIVTSKVGKELFRLDGTQRGLSGKMTAQDLYKEGVQWFEPTADHYMPLISIAPEVESFSEMKHFTWDDIVKFSEIDRFPLSYFNGFDGDWKAHKDGGDGYLLVTVNGVPYWADAIGQIPFAVDILTDIANITDDYDTAEKLTSEIGKLSGDGKFPPEFDFSNSSDNAMIRRAINWTKKRYDLKDNRDKWHRGYFDRYRLEKTNYHPDSLSKSSDGIDIVKSR